MIDQLRMKLWYASMAWVSAGLVEAVQLVQPWPNQ